jgi:hypothetical protein
VSDDRWIVVPNWDKFQSYSERSPAWIKVYPELNSHDGFRKLSSAEKGTLLVIWCEYARSNCVMSTGSVREVCGKSYRSEHLVSLNHAGFIEFSAVKPLSRARVRAREEKRREELTGAHAQKPKPKNNTGDEHRENASAYKKYVPEPPEPVDSELALELTRKLAKRYDR